MEELAGLIPPLVTPFDNEGNISYEKLIREIEYLTDLDIQGIGLSGSTGEGITLTDEEIVEIIEVANNYSVKDIPVVVGIIRNSTKDAIQLTKKAESAGADAFLVTPTFYHGASSRGNISYYEDISANTDLPIIVYNVIPTNPIDLNTMKKIGEIDNIIGIKQIDAEAVAKMVDGLNNNLKVFSACDDVLLGTYICGAVGAIAAIITAVPELCIEQWDSFQAGDMTKAQEIDKKLYHVFKAYFDEKPFVGKIKYVINLLGRDVGVPRKPVQTPTDEKIDFMKEQLKKANLL